MCKIPTRVGTFVTLLGKCVTLLGKFVTLYTRVHQQGVRERSLEVTRKTAIEKKTTKTKHCGYSNLYAGVPET